MWPAAPSADCVCNPYQQAFAAQLQQVEKERYAAMTENKLERLSALLGDDLIYIHSTGVAQTKTELLEGLKSAKVRYRKITTQPQAIRFYGDVGILNGRGTFDVSVKDGDTTRDLSLNLVFTATYVMRGEGLARHWELVSWQSGAVPQPKQ